MTEREKLQLAYQKIKNAQSILLVGHNYPDPDALASIGALSELLDSLKIKKSAYAQNKPVGIYDFIPHSQLVSGTISGKLEDFSLIIILDCGSLARTGLLEEINNLLLLPERPYIIEFDHHQPQDKFADLEIRLPKKASTTEVIYDFFVANSLAINKTVAECILIGLISDTGHFLHANATHQALAIASKMLLKGASLNKLSSKVRGSSSLSTLKVWGRALEKLKFNPQTGFAYTALTNEELKELLSAEERAAATDIFGDIASFISYLSGVKVALFLREEEGKVKGSLRTNTDEIDVALLARQFNGGGDRRAAGFSIIVRTKETDTGWFVVKARE